MKHDLIVVGTGPVAAAAAVEGARIGMDVLLAGGTGEPESARMAPLLASRWAAASLPGTRGRRAPPQSRWTWLQARIHAAERAYIESLEEELRESGVQVAARTAPMRESKSVEVGGCLHRADVVVVAAHARRRRPQRFAYDEVTIFDPTTILGAKQFPRSVAVVGADEEGCEIASLFGALGASVLLLDRRACLLRGLDRDLLRQLHAAFQQAGVEIVLEEQIEDAERSGSKSDPHVIVSLGSGRREAFSTMVVCAGWNPMPETIALGGEILATDARGFPMTDDRGRTSLAGVYAVGDVAGMSLDLRVQIQVARATVRHAAQLEAFADVLFPTTVHTIPETAFAGLSEEACARLGIPYAVGLAPLRNVRFDEGAASDGLLKVVVRCDTREIVGIHALGPGASETVYATVAMLQTCAAVDGFTQRFFPVESAAESIRLAAWRAIAGLPRRVGVPGAPRPESLF
jgi:pyruvate/2-oxoglutarate dehydrogenase complex dihydrolipoamide dehydrogenase (E3) component